MLFGLICMSNPPLQIDGAKVLEWAWSGSEPFGVVRYTSGDIAAEIFGLAICQYPNSDAIYRFSCDSNWESKQDSDYSSLQEAKSELPEQYTNQPVKWQSHG